MNQINISLERPLAALVESCAVHCQVDCCELGAFDVNAYTMLWWLRDPHADADLARTQLMDLMRAVESVAGPVRIEDFCYQWAKGEECAEYLKAWLDEYSRALMMAPEGTPPAQRLREAADRGRSEYCTEVYRMAHECGWADPPNAGKEADRQRAIGVLMALAQQQPEQDIKREVEYARQVLSKLGLSWNGEGS